VRPRSRADQRRLRLAAVEQDRGRDREDVVPRGGEGVLVDVQLRELDLSARVCLELLEDRLDCAAGSAPRRPEVEDDWHVALKDVAVEGRVGDLEHGLRVAG